MAASSLRGVTLWGLALRSRAVRDKNAYTRSSAGSSRGRSSTETAAAQVPTDARASSRMSSGGRAKTASRIETSHAQ